MNKKPSTKITKSKNNKEKEVRDQYTVVLEDIRSQNKAVAELVIGLGDKLDEHSKRFDTIDAQLERLHIEIQIVKEELNIIKAELVVIKQNQITRDEFRSLETRVAHLERVRK